MQRWSYLIYGITCHAFFFVIYAYLAAFVGNLWVPRTIDSGPSGGSAAAIVDVMLVLLFCLQHSIMARPWFKQQWTRIVPQPIERSTYVLMSNIVTCILIWQWRIMDTIVWDVQQPIARGVMWGLFAVGWLMVPVVSFMINHFDLFGTRQVWLYFQGRPNTPLQFRTPMLYGRVRHPLYVGWALAFWAIPTMTIGHLLFATTMTLYMVVATAFEERDLLAHFGAIYRDYQERVPRFFPRLGGIPTTTSGDPIVTKAASSSCVVSHVGE